MIKNEYGSLASWVYNLDKPVGHSFGDIEFYQDRLSGCRGTILEPAVGNGRILIPLLESGLNIQGFDASDDMLKFCRTQCHQRNLTPCLENKRFQDFHYNQQFEAIIVPLGSFQLIDDFGEAFDVLQRFYAHLQPQGRLIVDIDPIGEFFRNDGRFRKWTIDIDAMLTLQETSIELDYIAQRTVSSLRYEHWQSGKLVKTELEIFSMRWWGVAEFELALKQVGFTNIRVFGNYTQGRLPGNVRTITFEAHRG